MTTQEKLRILLTTYPSQDYIIDTLEISHPEFSQSYYFTREAGGLTATTEAGQTVTFQGVNYEYDLYSSKSDLDKNFSFTLADLENKLDDELDRIGLNNDEKIRVIYRDFNASDLSAPGDVFRLEAVNVSQEKGTFTIVAGAPQLNWSKTGIIYDYDTFPTLRAL